MTGADNSDQRYVPSKVFKKWDKEKKIKKPRKIPEGFEWDPKAKELIDTRCNNSKLRKLVRESVNVKDIPALCMSPFYTLDQKKPVILQAKVLKGEDKKRAKTLKLAPDDLVIVKDSGLEKIVGDPISYLLKRKRNKEILWQHYPHIPILETNARLRRSLLGLRLQWTFKEDGQNITIWKRIKQYCKKKQEIVISSHNQEIASTDIKVRVMKAPEFSKILNLIEDNPTFRVNAEECAKGASITGIKRYPKDILIVFDIFDTAINNFLPYTQVYQYCYHYKIPVVQLYATTRHRTIKDLVKFANHVLEYCNTEKDYGKDEGMVCKAFRPKHRCRDCGKEW